MGRKEAMEVQEETAHEPMSKRSFMGLLVARAHCSRACGNTETSISETLNQLFLFSNSKA